MSTSGLLSSKTAASSGTDSNTSFDSLVEHKYSYQLVAVSYKCLGNSYK